MGEPSAPTKVLGKLPFRGWWPFLAGVAAGLILRLAFSGKPGGAYAAMTAAFVYFCPMIVGAVTVYVAERQQRRRWSYYFWAPVLANVLFVIGTLLIMIEGLICAVIIVPLFALIGGVAGVVMGAVCRVTRWPRQALLSVAVVPFFLGAVEPSLPPLARTGAVERSILVNAAPEEVWRQIINAHDIRRDELERAWIFRIGVPLPLAGVTRHTPDGAVRRVTMGKQVYFDEVIVEANEPRFLRWVYRFYPDSFPPYALDEHVVIGGHYFDLRQTTYTLTPKAGRTELTVRMEYRVSTQFNWYADPVARLLLGDMEEAHLDFYRRRSEQSSGQ